MTRKGWTFGFPNCRQARSWPTGSCFRAAFPICWTTAASIVQGRRSFPRAYPTPLFRSPFRTTAPAWRKGRWKRSSSSNTAQTRRGAIPLKNKEYELLLFLMRHPGQVFSREDLYEMIWGLESMGDNITVAVHIGRIREKIEADPSDPKLLQTVWGVGYQLNAGTA